LLSTWRGGGLFYFHQSGHLIKLHIAQGSPGNVMPTMRSFFGGRVALLFLSGCRHYFQAAYRFLQNNTQLLPEFFYFSF